MKIVLLILTVFLTTAVANAQMMSGSAEIVTVYSQNERYYLKSIPYDDASPSLKGETAVYESGKSTPLYTLDRGFDPASNDENTLFLSNDGEVIFYVITWGAHEKTDGMRSVNVYKRGSLIASFTESEITGCDKKKERCSFVYSNFWEVIDRKKSNLGTPQYKKVLRDDIDEKERFLGDFAIFSFDDAVYLTDAKKRTHIFDLRDGRLVESDSFDNLFDRIKSKGRFTKTAEESYRAPTFHDFPKLRDGTNASVVLAKDIGMEASGLDERSRYKVYIVEVVSRISQDGTVEIESIDVPDGLPKEKILEFFKSNKFDTSSIPTVFPKWHLGEQSFYFRNQNVRTALQEGRQQRIKDRQDSQQRLTAETIKGVYIPANMGECFVELDKKLSEIDKKEMKALPTRENMIRYHRGLGMWVRNNWGLWGGSRLSKYLSDRGESHPEGMSTVILYHYHDWLNGKTETWKDWEKKPKKRAGR